MAGDQHETMTGQRPPGIPPWSRQVYIDGAAACVDALGASAEAQRASGDMLAHGLGARGRHRRQPPAFSGARAAASGRPGGGPVSWITNAADRAAGALRGAWDAARGTAYEPLEGRSEDEITSRERAVYNRWLDGADPRNAYERSAYDSIPHEITAEMDRAEQAAREADADAGQAAAEQDARDWETARARWEAAHGQEAGS